MQLSVGSMLVSGTTFDSNVAGEAGGALAVATASAEDTYILTDCVFLENSAGGEGGGAVIFLVDTDADSGVDVEESEIGTMTFKKWVRQPVGGFSRRKSDLVFGLEVLRTSRKTNHAGEENTVGIKKQ